MNETLVSICSFILIASLANVNAQDTSRIHEGTFKRSGFGMSSRKYKPDTWEKPYYSAALKSAFPIDLVNFKDKFINSPLLMTGIVDSAEIQAGNDSVTIRLRIENKYWDYTEDYSIQDEVMFVSPKGGGPFYATVTIPVAMAPDEAKDYSEGKRFVFIYGRFIGVSNEIPVIQADQMKWVRHFWYSTNIFSYDVDRNEKKEVKLDKKGNPVTTDFHILSIAHKGQNK